MATIIYPHTFVPNTPARASEVNANFDAITDEVNGNIDADNLADNAVTSAKIVDEAVTTAKLGDGAVTDTKVTSVGATKVTGTLTNAQLASGIDASKLTTGTLPIARIADGAVTNAKLASGIDAAKLTTGTLPIARIADEAVTAAKIDDGAVTPAKVSFMSPTPQSVYAGAVSSSGTAISLPSGWTSSRPLTGVFRITHNLGIPSTRWIVMGNSFGGGSASAFASVDASNSNYFDVEVLNTSGGFVNTRVDFIAWVLP